MALFNQSKREINAKVVYYGPALCGKTTNIKYIHDKLKPENRGKLLSLATQKDRTLFFDFLPVELGEIKGLKTRFHLYTVPGQVYYNGTRKMVLKGVDGLVFVADSQPEMMKANLESLQNLRDNMAEYGRRLEDIPYIIQYNKRDLPDALPVEEMDRLLNRDKVPSFTASALNGRGVLQTMTTISKMVLHRLRNVHRPPGEDRSEERSMGASYRALRKDSDRLVAAPAASPQSGVAQPRVDLPSAVTVVGLGRARGGGNRITLPVTVKYNEQVKEILMEIRVDIEGGALSARVEKFDPGDRR